MTEDMINRLKDFSLFQDFAKDKSKLAIISSIMTPFEAKAGDYLFMEGDEGDDLYLLMEGDVRVTKFTRQKEEYTIVDLHSSQNVFFGEMALMDHDLRSASIMLLKNSSFMRISYKDFVALGAEHPEICLPITQVISKIIISRLRRANDDVILLFDSLVDEMQANHL